MLLTNYSLDRDVGVMRKDEKVFCQRCMCMCVRQQYSSAGRRVFMAPISVYVRLAAVQRRLLLRIYGTSSGILVVGVCVAIHNINVATLERTEELPRNLQSGPLEVFLWS